MKNNCQLFQPAVISGRTIPTRLFLAPVNTGFALRGDPTEDLFRFHQTRSGPEIGLSMVGNVAVSADLAPHRFTAVLDQHSSVALYRRLAHMIKGRGSLAGIQLASSPDLSPARNWVTHSSAVERLRLLYLLSQLSDHFVNTVLNRFITATRLAAQADFDLIQIHAAHGYLLSLLLNPFVNHRSGYFRLNGSWFSDFISAIVETAAGSLVSIRMSIISGLTGSARDELAFARTVSQSVAAAGAHFIDFVAGFYTVDRRLIYPGIERGALPFLDQVFEVSRGLDCLCGVGGNVQDIAAIPSLPKHFAVSLGRALIADPDLLRKVRLGRDDEIRKCKRTARCHYFSRSKVNIECGVNESVRAQLRYE